MSNIKIKFSETVRAILVKKDGSKQIIEGKADEKVKQN